MKVFLCRIMFVLMPALLLHSCKKQHTINELTETAIPVLTAHSIIINDVIHGFYTGLPAPYDQSAVKYPLLIWIHGSGQFGNGHSDLRAVLYGGVPKLLDQKLFPAGFTVKGQYYSFIILAPQFQWRPQNEDMVTLIEYAKKNYRVDESRIYLSGLSMGGTISADFGAQYTSQIAAIVPISGVSFGDYLELKCKNIAAGQLPVWTFCNSNDEVFSTSHSKAFTSLIKNFNDPVQPKYTEFSPFGDDGHDAWTKATDPNYRENGMNMYEWMLQYHR